MQDQNAIYRRVRDLAFCALCAWGLAVLPAQAAHGRIQIFGTVSTPTCTVATGNLEKVAHQARGGAVDGACPSRPSDKNPATRKYELSIAALRPAMTDSRINVYFQDFTVTPHEMLATQTYE